VADQAGRPDDKRRVMRRLLFALAPLLVLLAAATLILSQLEKRRVVITERPDDSVMHRPVNLLERVQTDQGEMFRLSGYNIRSATFPVQKAENTGRIVLAGESFVLGIPYRWPDSRDFGFGDIPNWVQTELEWRFPARRFEVINAGAKSRNSSGVREIVEALLPVEPDAVVVATGNNEGYIPVTAFNEIAHRWVVYRLLKKELLPEPELNERPYMMVQNPDSAALRANFERNIRAMARAAKEKNVRLVLCTMPINLRYQQPHLAVNDDIIRQGHEMYAQGRYQQAIEVFSRSARQAAAAKLIGDCLYALGEYEHAKIMYQISVEMDPQNRTRPSLNEIVRRVSREENTALADLAQAIDEQSPHGIADVNLFCDYCHMTWRGYYLAAREITRVLVERRLVGAGRDKPRPPPTAEEMIARRHWEILFNPAAQPGGCIAPPTAFGPAPAAQ